jgi:hypothetical protein
MPDQPLQNRECLEGWELPQGSFERLPVLTVDSKRVEVYKIVTEYLFLT